MTRQCPCGAALHNHHAKLCPPCRAEAKRIYMNDWYERNRTGDRIRARGSDPAIIAMQEACPVTVAWATLDRDYPWLRGVK